MLVLIQKRAIYECVIVRSLESRHPSVLADSDSDDDGMRWIHDQEGSIVRPGSLASSVNVDVGSPMAVDD